MVELRKEVEEGKDNKVVEGIDLNWEVVVVYKELLVGMGKLGMGTAGMGRDNEVHNSPFSFFLSFFLTNNTRISS